MGVLPFLQPVAAGAGALRVHLDIRLPSMFSASYYHNIVVGPSRRLFCGGYKGSIGHGALVSNGGRVLTVCATAASLAEARRSAYTAVDAIDWPHGFCRRDIGWRALA